MTQPVLGIVASAIVIAISVTFIALWDFGRFIGWVSFFALSFIPLEVVTGVIWGGKPPFLARLGQPARGLTMLLVTLAAGAVVSQIVYRTLGASQGEPGPMLAFFSICVIVTTFFWTIAFGGWPFTAIVANRTAAGLLTWLGCYAVGLAVYWVCSDFAFLRGTPAYVAEADPGGLFPAWNVVVYYMTALVVLFAWLAFDLWPLTRRPGLMRQPVLGAVLTGGALAGGYALYYAGVRLLDIQTVEFLLRVPIAVIFGIILVLNMCGNALFASPQPVKGALNLITAAVVGSVLLIGYQQLQPLLSGPVPPGPPEVQRELFQVWTANALLSVTFPLLVFCAAYFEFWPLQKASGIRPQASGLGQETGVGARS
jgi:hypothetical protein